MTAEEFKEWLSSSDPSMYGAPVSVTDEEVSKAVTMMVSLGKQIQNISQIIFIELFKETKKKIILIILQPGWNSWET